MIRSIKIIKPGLLTTVQDKGRFGYYHLGIPPSGCLDQLSSLIANYLVGNDDTHALLECTFLPPEIQFNCDAIISITGGEIKIMVDGKEYPNYTPIIVKNKSILNFGFMTLGSRIYIAINGGIDVPIKLNSRSTYIMGKIGGFKGRKLLANDILNLGSPKKNHNIIKESLPIKYRPIIEKNVNIRITDGLYDFILTEKSIKSIYEDTWIVTREIDRTGFRIIGPKNFNFIKKTPPFGAGSNPSNIVDACYPIGSLQISSQNNIIILHKDAVSGGGYAMVGNLISADMDLIAQMQPNYNIKFEKVTIEQALKARLEKQNKINAIKKYLKINN